MRLKDPDKLATLIHEGGWSYRTLAAACGLRSHTLIYQLATGRRPGCKPDTAYAIAAHLDVTPQYLFEVPASTVAGRDDASDGRNR